MLKSIFEIFLSRENDPASRGMAATSANRCVNPAMRAKAQTKYFLVESKCVELPTTVSAMSTCHFIFPIFPMLLSLAAGTKTTINPAANDNSEDRVLSLVIALTVTAVETQISEVSNELTNAVSSMGKATTISAANLSKK